MVDNFFSKTDKILFDLCPPRSENGQDPGLFMSERKGQDSVRQGQDLVRYMPVFCPCPFILPGMLEIRCALILLFKCAAVSWMFVLKLNR